LFRTFKLALIDIRNKIIYINKEMAPPEVISNPPIQDKVLFKLLSELPEYSPGDNLHIFIKELDTFITYIESRTLTNEQRYTSQLAIKRKLKGEARNYISYYNNESWAEIRAALLKRYGDQRSEDILMQTLQSCIQFKSESFQTYYSRITKALSELLQNVQLNSNNDIFQFKKANYTNLAEKTFKYGLIEPYRSYLSHFNTMTLQEALNKCRELDNTQAQWEYSEFIRRVQEKPKHNDPFSFKPFPFRPQPQLTQSWKPQLPWQPKPNPFGSSHPQLLNIQQEKFQPKPFKPEPMSVHSQAPSPKNLKPWQPPQQQPFNRFRFNQPQQFNRFPFNRSQQFNRYPFNPQQQFRPQFPQQQFSPRPQLQTLHSRDVNP